MQLKNISERVGYIQHSTNLGVIRGKLNSAVLVDTGLDKDTGKKVLKLLDENKLRVSAIVNTHSHGDHCGGNRVIQERTGAKIYAPEIEASIIRDPLLEPLCLFSGASPPKDLQNKFLMAAPSEVSHIVKPGEKLAIDGIELTIVLLPGHSPNQIGVEADGIIFCADSIFSQETLDKHKVPFFMDIDRERETLAFLKNSAYKFYVPSHAEPGETIAAVIDANLKRIDEIENLILAILDSKKTTGQILREVCGHYQIEMQGMQQYYLMNTAIMAYLSSLAKAGKLKAAVSDNILLWEKIA